MKIATIRSLQDRRWVHPLTGSDFEVEIVPAAMPDLSGTLMFGMMTEQMERAVCTRAFVDFRNLFEDDDTPVKNTLEARLELYRSPNIRAAINGALQRANNEALQGEAVAVAG